MIPVALPLENTPGLRRNSSRKAAYLSLGMCGSAHFLSWGINFGLTRLGENWGIRGMTDVAVLPAGDYRIVRLFLSPDARDQHDDAHHGVRGGHVRPECCSSTRWRGQRRPDAGRISQT